MRRIFVTVAATLALVAWSACSHQEDVTGGAAVLTAFANTHLPDDVLRSAAPSGYTVTAVPRDVGQFKPEGWITVGVRLQSSAVQFARAIYYVLPSSGAARAFYERQIEITDQQHRQLTQAPRPIKGKIPKTFSEPSLQFANLCGVRVEGLFWCHAFARRIYLLVQSSATRYQGSRIMAVPSTEPEARRLLRAFAGVLASGNP